MLRNKKLVGAALVVTAVIFAGTASTAALTVPAGVGATLGYDTSTVTGGTVVSMHYNLDQDTNPANIESVTVVVVDPAIQNGNLVPQLSIRLDSLVPENTGDTDCGTGVQSFTGAGTQAGVPGAGVGTVADADSVVTFTCGVATPLDLGTISGGLYPVNALTLSDNYLTIQNV